jgi:hypothetical protein
MGMNPVRAGGSAVYNLTQRGLITTADAYGVGPAAMNPLGIAQAAAGAPASSFGAKNVTPLPPTLRGPASASAGGISQVPIVGPAFAALPGGSAVQLVVFAILAYFALRWVIRESE